MDRVRQPEMSIGEFVSSSPLRNERLLATVKASGDEELDAETFKKTLAEVDRGVIKGPFKSLDEVPYSHVALLPRHGIWEQHGGATERSCRCIDDMLKDEQNKTVGAVSAHRPTDPDGLVSQVRALRRRYPSSRLSGWPCDLEKAYKQVPGDALLIMWSIIVVWNPSAQAANFFVALCQLFGGKSPPLGFRKVRGMALRGRIRVIRFTSYALRRRHYWD